MHNCVTKIMFDISKDGFYDLFKRLEEGQQGTTLDEEVRTIIDRARLAYRQKLDDDLNTPMALAVLQNMRSNVNKRLERWDSIESRKRIRAAFREFGGVLGLFQLDSEQWQFGKTVGLTGVEATVSAGQVSVLKTTEIERLLGERLEARKRKDFAKADEIRKRSKQIHHMIFQQERLGEEQITNGKTKKIGNHRNEISKN